jgi:hypothetical protein
MGAAPEALNKGLLESARTRWVTETDRLSASGILEKKTQGRISHFEAQNNRRIKIGTNNFLLVAFTP